MSGINQKWLTVRQLANLHTAFTESSIRWLIFKGDISSSIRKINGRVLINLDDFENWVESHKQKGGVANG